MKTIDELKNFKFTKPNKNNFWFCELLYGYDIASDKTVKLQVPKNINFIKIK